MTVIFYIKMQATIHLSWIWVSTVQVPLCEAGAQAPITARGEPGRTGQAWSPLTHPKNTTHPEETESLSQLCLLY